LIPIDMDGGTTSEPILKDKKKNSRPTRRELKDQLKTAKNKIVALEKENVFLHNRMGELSTELKKLETKLEAHKSGISGQSKPSPVSPSTIRSHASNLDSPTSRTTSQSMAGSTDSASPFSLSNGLPKKLSILRPPSPSLSSAETSEASPNNKIGSTKLKVRFKLDSGTFEAGNDEQAAAPLVLPYISSLSESEADHSASESTETVEYSLDKNRSSEEAHHLLFRMSKGENLEEAQLGEIAAAFFDDEPCLFDYLTNQEVRTVLPRTSQMNGELTTTAMSSNKSEKSGPLLFYAAPDFKQIHTSPFPAFTEQVSKIRFANGSSTILSLSILTFASTQSFLGFHLSRSTLKPGDDARLTLSLVGTASQLSHSFTVLIVIPHLSFSASRSSNQTILSSPPHPQLEQHAFYYCFGSKVQFETPKPDISAWKISLTQLIENTSISLLSTPTSSIYRANLLGASLTSRIFKRHDSLSDLTAFEKLVSLSNTLVHPNIASVIGISDKRPFRIISQSWRCSLTASLMATCIELSRLSPSTDLLSHNGPTESSLMSSSFSPYKLLESYGRHGIMAAEMRRGEVPMLLRLRDRIIIAQDVLASVLALHSSKLVHRDLCTDAFGMVDESYAILVEWLSAVETCSKFFPGKLAFSHQWVAPEVSATPASMPTTGIDIYAFGVILMDLTIGAPLSFALGSSNARLASFDTVFGAWSTSIFGGTLVEPSLSYVVIKNTTGKFNEMTTNGPLEKLCSLVALCCHSQPSRRPTLAQISNILENVMFMLS
jgi:hypothetical protein